MSIKVRPVKELAPMIDHIADPHTMTNRDNLTVSELENLVGRINSMPTPIQRQIYLYLRQYKEPSFFTTDGDATFFDFRTLTPGQQRNVYNFIELCRQDQTRQEVLKQAEQDHQRLRQETMLAASVPVVTEERMKPESERERYERMLEFNRK
jgi:hypothetical protein